MFKKGRQNTTGNSQKQGIITGIKSALAGRQKKWIGYFLHAPISYWLLVIGYSLFVIRYQLFGRKPGLVLFSFSPLPSSPFHFT